MRPILFFWNGRPVYSYRACLLLAMVVFSEAMTLQITARHLPLGLSLGIVAVLMSAAAAGTRVLFVLCHWDSYRNHRERIWARGESGASILGGLVALYVIGVPLLWVARLPVERFLDMIALAALPAMFVGRLGCLLHGCCCGRAMHSRRGLRMTPREGASLRRWPVAAMEMGAVLMLSAVTQRVLPDDLRPGMTFLIVVSCYCLLRVGLDFLRDQPHSVMSISQTIALGSAILNAGLIIALTHT